MTPQALHALTKGLTEQGLRRAGYIVLTPEQPIDHLVPRGLADDQGFSMFLARGREIQGKQAQIDAEASLMLAAYRCAAPSVPVDRAEALSESASLSADQAEAFVGIMTSGRSVEVLIGPAGTGKSYTLARLAEHWHEASRRAGTSLPSPSARTQPGCCVPRASTTP